MASRKTRSSTKTEIKNGNQRTLFDLVGGKPRVELLDNEAGSSTILTPLEAEISPLRGNSDRNEPTLGESQTTIHAPDPHDKPLRRMRSSRKMGVTQPRSGAVYSIFSSAQPSQSTLDYIGTVTANPRTSTPPDTPDAHGLRVAASESPGVEEVLLPEQGSSRDDAILISSSPVRSIRAPRTFRAERARKTHAGIVNDYDSMPYPSDTHIRGTQQDFIHPRAIPFSRRLRHPHSPVGGSTEASISSLEGQHNSAYHAMPTFRHEVAQEVTAESVAVSYTLSAIAIEELRRDSCRHPAIERLLGSIGQPLIENAAEDLMWSEKWRPSAANQVLGNESSARYLRDWLATLQLGQASFSSTSESSASMTKRKRQPAVPSKPVVLRAVDRAGRRKRARLNSDDDDDMGWIAEDEESDELTEGVADDELLLRGQRQATPVINSDTKMQPEVERISFEVLTNTILISGPTGAGKTAAVFACAAELGYEVFEVYPGIGRRSGVELDRLIGDVGKNHLVNKSEPAQRTNQSKSSNGTANPIFGASVRKSPGISTLKAIDTSSNADRLTSSYEGFRHSPAPSVGQSIVLLEEVDILFKDDTNFWPTVVNIIKECRRPVVLTCNDSALVPIEDLPLQAILEFQPCLASSASCLLQAMALANGKNITRQDAARIYNNTRLSIPVNIPDIPLHPFTQYPPHPDLRLAIHMLEYLSKSNHNPHPPDRHPSDTREASIPPIIDTKEQLRQVTRLSTHANNISFADFALERRIEECEEAEQTFSEHDEIGSAIVYGDNIQHPWPQSLAAFYTRDQAIFQDVLDMSQRALAWHVIGHASAPVGEAFNGLTTFRARADYQGHMVAVLGDLLSISSPLLPRPAVFVDYDAWIRIMVRQDDDLEALGNREMSRAVEPLRRGRITRNSQKYTRWLNISDEHRQTLKATSLSWE